MTPNPETFSGASASTPPIRSCGACGHLSVSEHGGGWKCRDCGAELPGAEERQSSRACCCVDGCGEPGTHRRGFYIRGVDPSAYGEIETAAAFCCEHIDMLDSDVTPLVDLHVSATVRS